MALKRRGLGRNLEALLGDVSKPREVDAKESLIEGDLKQLPIEQIQAGKYQPRKDFPQDALEELANSIRAQGVIQPIVVRSLDNQKFEIIAGERRWRAAQIAGLETIPALIRELPDEAAIAMALIENIQREDLNPIEEATALQRLIAEFAMTHEQVANAVGKSRTAVSNLLRLLSLSQIVKDLLAQHKLEMGHARALLSLGEAKQIEYARLIVAKGLSVREAENLVRNAQFSVTMPSKDKTLDPAIYEIQQRLGHFLSAKVAIQQNAKGRGKISIKYKNPQELESLLNKLLPDLN